MAFIFLHIKKKKKADEVEIILKVNEAEYSISRGHKPVLAYLTSKWPRLLSHAASEACIPVHTNSAPCTSLTSHPNNTINTPLSSHHTQAEEGTCCSYSPLPTHQSYPAAVCSICPVIHGFWMEKKLCWNSPWLLSLRVTWELANL